MRNINTEDVPAAFANLSIDAQLISIGWIIQVIDNARPELDALCMQAHDGTIVPFDVAAEFVYSKLFNCT